MLFPWGALLRAAATADAALVTGLAATCQAGAAIDLVTAIERAADAAELQRLGLTGWEPGDMATSWRAAGFATELEQLPPRHCFETTWSRRLAQRQGRRAWWLRLRAP